MRVVEWDDFRVRQLKERWKAGDSILTISKALGISDQSISRKAHMLGLGKRDNPAISKKLKTPLERQLGVRRAHVKAPEGARNFRMPLAAGSPASWGAISNERWPGEMRI